MIRQNCFFKANNETDYKKALDAAMALAAQSLKHEGNVAYDVFESTTRKDVFMICETWQNQEVLDMHSATPEFAEGVGIMQQCGELKLEIFNF